MGLIVDTTVFVQHERMQISLIEVVERIKRFTQETRLGIAVITLAELAHGQERADYQRLIDYRAEFLTDLMQSFTIYQVDEKIAVRAGLLDGRMERKGDKIGLADLLIAATAIEIGYGVITHNMRHFTRVPGLTVVNLEGIT